MWVSVCCPTNCTTQPLFDLLFMTDIKIRERETEREIKKEEIQREGGGEKIEIRKRERGMLIPVKSCFVKCWCLH